ncbi:MAG: hypothetical protein H7X94_15390 [Vallitaleaceae bacterium]|nr:hypothetical protein [Vallitaleaceae bacterium]
MAYCPKCGVELDNYIKNCPLCDFPIPNTLDPSSQIEEDALKKYPHAININRKDQMIMKNKIFFSFLVVVISAVIILAILKLIYPHSAIVADYAMLTFIALLFYMFFLFGYLKFGFNLIGLALTTLFITYSIDYQMESVSWFLNFALPIVSVIYVDALIFFFLYKKSRKRNQFVYVPSLSLLFLSILCMGIDGVISHELRGTLRLSWSLIVLISSSAITIILLGVYHGIPEKSKTWLKRKLHV